MNCQGKRVNFPYYTHTNYFHSLFFLFFCFKTLFSHALLVGTRESRSSLESSLCEKWFSAGEIHHNNFLFLVTTVFLWGSSVLLLPSSLFQLPFVQLKVQLTSIGHYSLGHIHMRETINELLLLVPSQKNATQWFLKGIPLKCIISLPCCLNSEEPVFKRWMVVVQIIYTFTSSARFRALKT